MTKIIKIQMKNIQALKLIMIFGLCMYSNLFSQDDPFEANKFISELSSAPQTPEAAAFMTYGDVTVSLYTGVPDVSVPIYTIKGKELDLPITLTYDARGLKVGDLASWVGAGWNLNVGGRVTRVVNGMPDDKYSGTYTTLRDSSVKNKLLKFFGPNTTNNPYNSFENLQNAQEYYYDFMEPIALGCMDTQPDFFQVNVMGLNETIILDYNDNYKPKALDNNRIKINIVEGINANDKNVILSWKITNEDGTIFEFSQAEQTRAEGSAESNHCNVINLYNSSWVLTKVISANKKDTYEFLYTDFGLWETPQFANESVIATNFRSPYGILEGTRGHEMIKEVKVSQRFLSTIKHNSKIIVENTLGAREDIDIASALKKIRIYDGNATPRWDIKFNHSYFGSVSSAFSWDKRLKLDNIEQIDLNNQVNETYFFEYIDPHLVPSRQSKARDYWGFFNGANATQPSYPQAPGLPDGGNRNPSTLHAKKGLLDKIIYPTKGYTKFIYESHEVSKPTQNTSTVTFANLNLNQNSSTNSSAYYDENGNICDDYFGPGIAPKVKIMTFIIYETAEYNISYTGSIGANGYSRASLAFYSPFNGPPCEPGTLCAIPEGYTSYCDFMQNSTLYWEHNIAGKKILNKGIYSAMLVYNPGSGGSQNAQLNISREVTTSNYQNINVGGLRIKDITSFDFNDQALLKKKYIYKDASGKSTGIENYKPVYVSYANIDVMNAFGDIEVFDHYTRQAAMPTGDQAQMVYTSVQEIQYDIINNANNGKTTHTFYTDKSGISAWGSPPFENHYKKSLKGGNIKEQTIFDNAGDSLKYVYNDYVEYGSGNSSIFGLTFVNSPSKMDEQVVLWHHNNVIKPSYESHPLKSNTTYTPSEFYYICTFGPQNPSFAACLFPQALGFGSHASYEPRITGISGKMGGIKHKITKEYFNNNKITREDKFNYDPAVNYYLRDKRSKNSLGDSLKTVYYYPKDNVVANSALLISTNKLNETVKTENYLNGNLIFTQFTDYQNVSGKALPLAITTKKGTSPEEERVVVSYYSNGNIKEIKQPDGTITTFLWGYANQYMVAQIINCSYNSIPSSLISAITTASSSPPWGSEGNLLIALNNLRNHSSLANAMMTSYTHRPQVGVSTITDAKGDKIRYNYDTFGRLDFVEDKDGNILSENKYHYKNQ